MHKVGLIGVGTMGRTHARLYVSIPGVELAAVYDIRREAALDLVRSLGLPDAVVVDDPKAILDMPSVDVISVCVPTPWHREYVVEAAKAGKNIFCEKPIARTVDEAREMASACDAAGVRLMVGHVLRFFPEYAKARGRLAAGALGRPGVVRTSRRGGFPRAWNDWYANFEWSGGVTLDLAIHDIDWCCWCLGKPVRVHAEGIYTKEFDHLDYSLVTVRFENGAMAHIEGNWAYPGAFSTSLEVAGSEGLLSFDSQNAKPIRLSKREQADGRAGVMVPESPLAESPYMTEDKHFFARLDDGSPFLVSVDDATTAATVALAAIESMKTGLPVEL